MTLFSALALLAPQVALARPPAADDADANAFREVVERMQTVSEGLRDATFTFYQREWVDGAMTPLAVMAVKVRKPNDVFLEYVGDKYKGRKVLYRGQGWNEGRLRVDPNIMLTPVLNLDPKGRMAMDGQRYTIREMSVTRTVGLIITDALKVNDHPEYEPMVQDLGNETVYGETGRCFRSELPKERDPGFYGKKVKLCASPRTGLPNLVQIWNVEDGALRMVENYAYIGLKVNPGLSDADFDPQTHGL